MIKYLRSNIKVIKTSVGSAGVQAANRFLTIASGVFFARVLGPENYGVYVYAFSIMGLVMVLSESGLPVLILREVASYNAKKDWEKLKWVVHKGLKLLFVNNVIILSIAILFLGFKSNEMSSDSLWTAILMLCLMVTLVFTKFFVGVIQGHSKVVLGQLINMICVPALALVFFTACFLFLPGTISHTEAMGSQVIGGIVTLLFSIYVVHRLIHKTDDSCALENAYTGKNENLLKSAFSFVLIGAAGLLLTQIDLIVLGFFRPHDEVGIYRIATQGAMLVQFFLHISGNVISPKIAQYYADGKLKDVKYISICAGRAVSVLSIPVVLFLLIFGERVITLIFGIEYEAAYMPMFLLLIGQFFVAILGVSVYVMNMTGNESIVSRVLWGAAFLNITLNLIFVPIYGVLGAATSTAISLVMSNFAIFMACKKCLKIDVGLWSRLP